jgi:hypothetical protein
MVQEALGGRLAQIVTKQEEFEACCEAISKADCPPPPPSADEKPSDGDGGRQDNLSQAQAAGAEEAAGAEARPTAPVLDDATNPRALAARKRHLAEAARQSFRLTGRACGQRGQVQR